MNPFTILDVYNRAAQYCNEQLQGNITFLNFVMNLPQHYLQYDLPYLYTLSTDKHFKP